MRTLRMNRILFVVAAATGLAFTLGLASSRSSGQSASGSKLDSMTYSKIEAEVVVNASIADAWQCWSTSEGAESFFAPHAEIESHPGGPFEIWFFPNGKPGGRGAENLKVLSALPGEMISFEWNAPPQFAHARPQKTWIVVTFNAVDADHTRVRLVHLGWDEMKAKNPDHAEEWDKAKAYFEAAWPKVLGWMQQRFEEGPRWDEQGKPRWKNEQAK